MVFGAKKKQEIVISNSDLEAALNHINSMPQTVTQTMPEGWGLKQIKEWLLEDMPKEVVVGDSFNFGCGLWGHVMPLGYEFSNYPNDILIRFPVIIQIVGVIVNINTPEITIC